jgi:hypothetical protein
MGSKRSTAGQTANKRRARKVLKLSRRAKAEVKTLLKRNRAGSLTKGQLKTGLKEVEGGLDRMLAMVRWFL